MSAAITREIDRLADLPVEQAARVVRNLSDDVEGGRSLVVDAKIALVHRARDEGFSLNRIAEMLRVSVGYIHNLKSVNGRGRRR